MRGRTYVSKQLAESSVLINGIYFINVIRAGKITMSPSYFDLRSVNCNVVFSDFEGNRDSDISLLVFIP